jgi:hypothetical protein
MVIVGLRLPALHSTGGCADQWRSAFFASFATDPRRHYFLLPGTVARGEMSKITETEKNPSQRIDERIAELGDWRGALLSRLRQLIHEAEPEVVEEWKWRGVPVWYRHGMICTGETYKAVVKMTFAKGAAIDDPAGLFNASLDGNVRRAIDFREGEAVDEEALKALIRAAVALNAAGKRR